MCAHDTCETSPVTGGGTFPGGVKASQAACVAVIAAAVIIPEP